MSVSPRPHELPQGDSIVVKNSRKSIIDAAAAFERGFGAVIQWAFATKDDEDDMPNADSYRGERSCASGTEDVVSALEKLGAAFAGDREADRLAAELVQAVALSDLLDADRQAIVLAVPQVRLAPPQRQAATVSSNESRLQIRKTSIWEACECPPHAGSAMPETPELLATEMTLVFSPAIGGSLGGPLLHVALHEWHYTGQPRVTRMLDATATACLVRLLSDICACAGLRFDAAGF